MKPRYFKAPEDFRRWLETNHATANELLVGFYKVDSGKPSITWPQSVDEALCFGWIDGIRRSLGAEAYTIRFTPRKPTSIWSAVNIDRVGELTKAARMKPAGLAAFAKRDEKRSRSYSYERETAALEGLFLETFKANKKAWMFYEAQPPGYRRLTAYWVTSAKREATRVGRLAKLIEYSSNALRIPELSSPAAAKSKKRL